MPDVTPELLSELVTLHRLTQAEIMIAETRRAQAADGDIERELAANAQKGRERAADLDGQIRRLGGVPDTFGIALGRLNATAKAVFEQALPLDEAILGDLALESSLHDRAIYAKVLATTAGERPVVKLMEHLELAHAATIAWLHTRLAEVGLGGPTRLRPTPVQVVASVVSNAALLPMRTITTRLNSTISGAGDARERFEETVSSARDRVGETFTRTRTRAASLAESAEDVFLAGRDATLKQAEVEAREQGRPDVADSVHEARENTGSVAAAELPIKGFDNLTAANAVAKVRNLSDAQDVRTILAYEQAHKGRDSIVKAANARIEDLASQLASA